ncbi:MAG: translation initiation factor IF-2 [Deltaproteobacteria bacterium]|nr:translation initiation factor IF-2 [Deltaproteobacteria bacterium]
MIRRPATAAPPPPPPPVEAARPRTVRRPGPAGDPVDARPPARAEAARPAEPAVVARAEAPAPAPVEVRTVEAPAPAPVETAPVAVVVPETAKVEAAPAATVAAPSAPKPEPAPVNEAPAAAPAITAPVTTAAPAAAPAPAKAPVEANKAPVDAPRAAPAAEAPRPNLGAIPRAGGRADEPARAAEPPRAAPTAASVIASGLPRAEAVGRPRRVEVDPVTGQAQAAGQYFPGLGSAVVRPPPGYDPNDPMGNKRRAQAAAQASTQVRPAPRPAGPPPVGAGPAGPSAPRWDDRRDGGAPPPVDSDGPRRKGKGKRAGDDARRRGGAVEFGVDPMGPGARRRRPKGKVVANRPSPQAKAIKRRVEVSENITVSQLAHAMSVKGSEVIRLLMKMGQMVTVNDTLDFDTATIVASEFEFEVVNASFQEDKLMIDVQDSDDDMVIRPPVVTIMGHVDHGKTTLLDSIRRAKVAASEAGGITQHISSYQVEKDGQLITFIDTPGHAAFTAMRARGAQVTDIVVLVVAADDGVMPQTIEVVNHAKAADVDIIVAVNKCDRADARPDRVRTQLMEHGLVPEEYGGDVMFVNVSASKGDGIEALLEAILLTAEVQEYSANPERHAEGTVIEARLERGKGPVAIVLVQQGTLRRGDHFVVGTTYGRVRALTDCNGKPLKEAGPSTPVEIMGLEDVPGAGDNLTVVSTDKDAKTLAEHRAEAARLKNMGGGMRMTLEDLMKKGSEGQKLMLNLIIRADVGGSLEALRGALEAINVPGTEVRVLHSGVGAVTESDITLARTDQAIVIAFNVRPDANARRAMDSFGVEVRPYRIIYEAIEDVERGLKGLLAPTIKETVQGSAEIRQTFNVPKIGTIAGCFVLDGKIARSHTIRLLRDSKVVWEGRLGSLKRFKDDVREVLGGYECGMSLDGFNDIKVGDVLEAYTKEEVKAI